MNQNEFTLLEFTNYGVQRIYSRYKNHTFGFEDNNAKMRQSFPANYVRHLDLEQSGNGNKKNKEMLIIFMGHLSEFKLASHQIPKLRHVSKFALDAMTKKYIAWQRDRANDWHDPSAPKDNLLLFTGVQKQKVIDEICEDIKKYYYKHSMHSFGISKLGSSESFNSKYKALYPQILKERDRLSAKNIANIYDNHWREGKDFHLFVGSMHLKNLPEMIRKELCPLNHHDVVMQVDIDKLNFTYGFLVICLILMWLHSFCGLF